VTTVSESLDRLAHLARELERRGDSASAKQIAREVDVIRAETAPPELITPEEAARALGLRSVAPVKRWALDGPLEGYLQDRRILVSARSAAAMSESPRLARQLAWERELDEALAPFTFDDVDESEFGDTWIGRKPWATSGSA
jgi:hypothetical protein